MAQRKKQSPTEIKAAAKEEAIAEKKAAAEQKAAAKEKATAEKKASAKKKAVAKEKATAEKKAAAKKKAADKEKAVVKKKAAAMKKAIAEKKALLRTKEPPKPQVVVGATSGVGVNATWISVFERNEQVGEPDSLSDEQIAAFMIGEFPTLEASLFKHVDIVRSKYNRGGLSRKDNRGRLVRPKIHSRRHAEDGQAPAGSKQQSTLGGVPGRSATSTYKKDFKSHKK